MVKFDQLERVEDVDGGTPENRGAALEAGDVTVSQAGLIPRGPTSGRGAPTAGKPYIDTDLAANGKLILGTGTDWAYPDGTAVVEARSSAGGPTNFRAVGKPDNTIELSWDPVPGATAITVRETRSPNGVSGMPLPGSATSNTRGPLGTMGPYDYWITATVDGVETAESNHSSLVLPVSGNGGGDPGGGNVSPAFALKINGLNGGTGGHWNLGVGYPTGHDDQTWQELREGWTDAPYFRYNPATQAVVMHTVMNGGTTSSGAKYPRVEFRELMPGGSSKMTFKANNGTHIISGTTRATHFAPNKKEVCIAQLHDGPDDRWQIRIENTDIVIKVNKRGDENIFDETVATVALGTFFDWRVEMVDGITKFFINGVLEHTDDEAFVNDSTEDQYFKTGCYAQQNDEQNPPTEHCEIEMKNLFVSHSTTS